MPWSGSAGSQTFSRNDGSHTGPTTWQLAAAASVKILALDHDTHDQDISDGINACLKKDGNNTATANLPMGGFRHTNVGAGVARTDYTRFSDHQDGKGIYVPTVGGTANAITLTTGYSVDAYAAGQTFRFIAAANNSDATTVAVDGLAAKSIKIGSTALTAAQIAISTMVTITYDGTQFQLTSASAAPAAISVGMVAAWPMTTVPTGWLECDGSAVSRTTYAALFAIYSTSYGIGDGSTTFNLPNYKNYFLRGFDASGTDAASRTDRGDGTTGASVGTKQADDYLSHVHAAGSIVTANDGAHTHDVKYNLHTQGQNGGGGGLMLNLASNGTSTGTAAAQSNGAHTHAMSGDSAAAPLSGGTETRPKNITVKWCCLALPAAALAIGTGFTRTARLIHTGGIPAQVSTDGSNVTPSISETYIAEVFVPGPGSVSVTGVAVMNGDAVSGNIAVALADSSGNVVASSASTAQSGTDAYQRVAFSTAYAAVGPATYYVLLQHSSTSNRFNAHTFGNFGASKKTGETFGTFTTITPPTTFTTALGPIASLY